MDGDTLTLLPLEAHVAGIVAATERMADAATMSWPGAGVPTCPEWTLLDLVAHLGMVHRWATAALAGDPETMGRPDLLELEGRTTQDSIRWLREGSRRLCETLESAGDDVEALVFLKEAPPPRRFWARRQCHETTMHALDALAAQHDRTLRAEDAWFGAALAADGVDELLRGFWQRGRNAHRSSESYAVHLVPTDAAVSWVVEVGAEGTRSRRLADGEEPPAGHRIGGSAVDLYLALWNRGGSVEDADGILPQWREPGAIQW